MLRAHDGEEIQLRRERRQGCSRQELMTLGAILWVIAGLLIIASVVAVGVLCSPCRVSAEFDTDTKPVFRFKMAVFGGLLPVVSTTDKRPKDSARKRKRRAASRSRKSTGQNIAVYAPRMLRNGPRLISGIVAGVTFEALDADISFGLPDPADTGMIYGALTPVARLVGSAEHSHISLHPDFNDSTFNGRGRIAARFTPASLIPPLLSFGWMVFVSPRLSGRIR
ncbi:MAG: DUF2953 domain-containing protein [Hyphomicrobiales bacterium]|nr:DUF2953 domain-containing protein [Hyphomicrobiales bacterium]